MQDYRDKLKLIRKAEGLTQAKLAEMTGIALSTIKNYECGNRRAGLSLIARLINHPRFKKYTLWLMTGDLSAATEQIAPLSVPEEKNDDQ